MKRRIAILTVMLTLLISMLLLNACGSESNNCMHRDADDNGLCDYCGDLYTDLKDIWDEEPEEPSDKPTTKEYLVTFVYGNGDPDKTESVVENSRLTEAKPVREGYRFDGWYHDGELWDFGVNVVTSDVTLTAAWTKVELTLGSIEYNKNKTAISVHDDLSPDLFDAKCYLSDGTEAEVHIIFSEVPDAGDTVNVRLTATLGEVTKQVTIKNVKVYDDPILEYDKSIKAINVTNGLYKESFSARATDTFGENASVSVKVKGEYKPGDTVTVIITARDRAGNTVSTEVEGVKAYTNPTVTYNSQKKVISVKDALSAELFGVTAKDTFGKPCEIKVEADKAVHAGVLLTVTVTATDELGNETVRFIPNVTVYGTPMVYMDEFIYEDSDVSFIATVYDSFENELTPEITYEGELKIGNRITVTVKATDEAGNSVVKSRDYVVNHTKHSYSDGFCTVCGREKLQYERDGQYIYFGEYPQTLKADSVGITETVDSRGYYLGTDGFYYAKVVANPFGSGYTFSRGEAVTSGTAYYFKVEPIRWRILSEKSDSALILCDSIIANMAYDGYDSGRFSNSYKESDVRAWLNSEFYSTAFNDLQREMILTTTVDNSPSSTGYSYNEYACENTDDKIFLPSYKEVTDGDYGFSSGAASYDNARGMEVSDYARATGAWMSVGTTYYGNGYWWLRSPDYYSKNDVRRVNSDGYIADYYHVTNADLGVVPALRIALR